jgi:hypothetical protein
LRPCLSWAPPNCISSTPRLFRFYSITGLGCPSARLRVPPKICLQGVSYLQPRLFSPTASTIFNRILYITNNQINHNVG